MLDERLLDAPRAGLDDADVAVLAGRDDVAVVHVEGQRVDRAVGVVQGAVLRPVPQVEDLQGDTSGCDEPPIDFKTKVPFGLVCPGLARPKHNFCYVVNRRLVTT